MSDRVIDWTSPQVRGAVIGSAVLGALMLVFGTVLVIRSVRGSSTEVQGWTPTGSTSAPVAPAVRRPGWEVRNPGAPGGPATGGAPPVGGSSVGNPNGNVGNPRPSFDDRARPRVDTPGNPKAATHASTPVVGGSVGNPGGGPSRVSATVTRSVGNPSGAAVATADRRIEGSPVGNGPVGPGREDVTVNGQSTVGNPGAVRVTKGPGVKGATANPGNGNAGNPGNPSNPATVRKTTNNPSKGAGNPGNSRGGR